MTSEIIFERINVIDNIRSHLIKYDDFLFSYQNLYRIHHHLSPVRLWNCAWAASAAPRYSRKGFKMAKENMIGINQNPIQSTINKRKNKISNIFGFDEGIDDEYFINEIIGIDELPYEEFIKEDKKKEGSNE